MKRVWMILPSALLLLSLLIGAAGCGTGPVPSADPAPGRETGSAAPLPTETADATLPVTEAGKRVLVAVFSATGTTRGVAEKIAAIEDADLYEIRAAEPYTDADLNWNDRNSRSTREQNDKSARPALGGGSLDLSGYEKIYIGYPIWWGEEPRILDTFVESYDFSGVTLIPFCTSASSGVGRSDRNLAENAGSGNWLAGRRFSGSVSESDLRSWIQGLS